MDLGFKREFIPTQEQIEYLEALFDIRVWYWNKLHEFMQNSKEGKGSSMYCTYILKYLVQESALMKSVSTFVDFNNRLLNGVADSYAKAWSGYFQIKKANPATTRKPPKFRSSTKSNHGSVIFTSLGKEHKNPTVTSRTNRILHPKNLKLLEALPDNAEYYKTVCFSRHNGHYFISGTYECQSKVRESGEGQIGLDLGIKSFAVDNTGKEYKLPKRIIRIEQRIRKIQRALTKKQKGSNNYKKLQAKLDKAYDRKTNIGKDFTEKLSTELLDTNKVIALETVDFVQWRKGQGKGGRSKLAASQLGYFVKRLQDKSKFYPNCKLIFIDKWYPSTQTCSHCGNIKPMPLKERTYICPKCGMILNRDHNSAVNILAEGLRALSAEVTAH